MSKIELPELFERKGKFQINLVEFRLDPMAIMAVMSSMVVVRAETMYMEGVIEYRAYSPLFDVVDMYASAPEYDIDIEGMPEGKYRVTVNRRD